MENKKRNRLILIILIPILFFFILGIFGYLAFKPYSLSGMAMSPKYKNGQIYLSNKLSYAFGSPKRNDVIIFNPVPNKV